MMSNDEKADTNSNRSRTYEQILLLSKFSNAVEITAGLQAMFHPMSEFVFKNTRNLEEYEQGKAYVDTFSDLIFEFKQWAMKIAPEPDKRPVNLPNEYSDEIDLSVENNEDKTGNKDTNGTLQDIIEGLNDDVGDVSEQESEIKDKVEPKIVLMTGQNVEEAVAPTKAVLGKTVTPIEVEVEVEVKAQDMNKTDETEKELKSEPKEKRSRLAGLFKSQKSTFDDL